MNSIWDQYAERPQFGPLQGDITTDVCIVGGGIAGILCAYVLRRAGVDCVVAEADTVCGGITHNTTAKITCQHGLLYDKISRRYGENTAKEYYLAQKQALDTYARLSRKIDFDFQRCDAYVYSLDNRDKIEKEIAVLQAIGCKATWESRLPLPFSVAGAVKMENQAQCNPLKLLFTLARELTVYEHTRVITLTPGGAVTDNGKISTKAVIVATHFPFINKYGGYFLKMYQHRSYVLALQNTPPFPGMYVDEDDTGLSFRHYGDYLLLGGGGHRTGKSGGNWQELRDFAAFYYPGAKEVAHWATQDCKTLDDIPYIGRYSPWVPRVYVATGFNKWGMTNAMVAATLLADMVQGKSNRFAQVFSPARRIWYPQLAVNATESVINLCTPTAPRCPHLGCALKYNPQEHSWDCPCHGSRFAEDGTLLDNPATHDKVL